MKESEYNSKQILTKREKEVFELLVQDKTTRDIAQELFISEKNSKEPHFKCNAKARGQRTLTSSGGASPNGGIKALTEKPTFLCGSRFILFTASNYKNPYLDLL